MLNDSTKTKIFKQLSFVKGFFSDLEYDYVGKLAMGIVLFLIGMCAFYQAKGFIMPFSYRYVL